MKTIVLIAATLCGLAACRKQDMPMPDAPATVRDLPAARIPKDSLAPPPRRPNSYRPTFAF